MLMKFKFITIGIFLGICILLFSCKTGNNKRNIRENVSVDLSRQQRQRLMKALEQRNAQYDPKVNMLESEFSSPGYHTTLKGGTVHRTRQSLSYAIALLDTKVDSLQQRAFRIMDKVIALQDQDPESETYGIWPWFLEEPLDQMSPPDWNWADFCGARLLEIVLTHNDILPDSLRKEVKNSVICAVESIKERDVGPGYTNIAIMGTFVTYTASELYDLPEINKYARDRLERFYDFTLHHGGFTEYNSPTYTRVALDELYRMKKYITDPQLTPMIDSLYHIGWDVIARHFHSPTRQWSGPHSRCYHTLLDNDTYGWLTRASGGELNFGVNKPEMLEHRFDHTIPSSLMHYFKHLEVSRSEVDTFINKEPPVIGTTYLTPQFTLGSVNRSNFWNQRRNILAYWGNYKNPRYMNVRFLHDDYDFAVANVFSVQERGKVLTGINFATNGGDTHISLDRIENGIFKANDLRLRFEFGNVDISKYVSLSNLSTDDLIKITLPRISLDIKNVFETFGPFEPHWEIGGNGETSWLDFVLYSGDKRTFNLNALKKAGLAYIINVSTIEKPKEYKVSVKQQEDFLSMKWNNMQLTIPLKPAKEDSLQNSYKIEK